MKMIKDNVIKDVQDTLVSLYQSMGWTVYQPKTVETKPLKTKFVNDKSEEN